MSDEQEISNEEMEKEFNFGIRLATSAQILQGLLSRPDVTSEDPIEMSVKLADKLIERCKR